MLVLCAHVAPIAALAASCANGKSNSAASTLPTYQLQATTPTDMLAAVVSTNYAPMPYGAEGGTVAMVPLTPKPVVVWFREPLTRIEITGALAPASEILRASSPALLRPSLPTQVVARVLSKVPEAVTSSARSLDDAVVFIDLVRFADANAVAEALGLMASLLGHPTDRQKMVLATLQRDGMLIPTTEVLDLSSLPAAITAVAIAPGARWKVSGRKVAVEERRDIYGAYEFMTGQALPQPDSAAAALADAGDAATHMARLALLWPQVLSAAHDHASLGVRELAARSHAAARTSELARQRNLPLQAGIWAAEALALARAVQAMAETSADARGANHAPRDLIEMHRHAVASQDAPEAQRIEDAKLAQDIAHLRWPGAPTNPAAVSDLTSYRGIRTQASMLGHLGLPLPPALIRWRETAQRYLAAESMDESDIAAQNTRDLHAVASQRLYLLTLRLDEMFLQQVQALMRATSVIDQQ